MNTFIINSAEENLSEDILNEEGILHQIKVDTTLEKNMSNNPFNKKKDVKRMLKSAQGIGESSLRIQRKRNKHWQSCPKMSQMEVFEIFNKTEQPGKSTLKQDIKILLTKAIKIRVESSENLELKEDTKTPDIKESIMNEQSSTSLISDLVTMRNIQNPLYK